MALKEMHANYSYRRRLLEYKTISELCRFLNDTLDYGRHAIMAQLSIRYHIPYCIISALYTFDCAMHAVNWNYTILSVYSHTLLCCPPQVVEGGCAGVSWWGMLALRTGTVGYIHKNFLKVRDECVKKLLN